MSAAAPAPFRPLEAAPIAFVSFIAALAVTTAAVRAGLVPDDTLALWAGAIIAGDGGLSLGKIVAAYPTLPFLATVGLEFLAPAASPVPSLIAALLAGALGAIWFVMARRAGQSGAVAACAVALLIFHPALLRALVAGPAEMLVALALFALGHALFDLRARGAAPEVMLASLMLATLTFSHSIGAALAIASVPFLVLAVRPTLLAASPFNVVLVLIFPAVFAVLAFAYVSWVFPGSGWSFYSAPAEAAAAWTAGTKLSLSGIEPIDAGANFALAILLGAPLAAVFAYRMRKRRPLLAPLIVLAASATVAAVLSIATGWFGDPASIIVLAPVLSALVLARAPVSAMASRELLPLLAAGWIGGAVALGFADPSLVAQLAGAKTAERERIQTLSLGHALAERDGVLVDTDNAPAVVVGRGNARGLLPPADESFALTLMFERVDSPFVAVPNPQSASGVNDRLNRAFPQLWREGLPGYRLVYQNSLWRLYARG